MRSSVSIFFPVLPFFFYKHSILAEMTTKFKKDMYAKMRSKKDESLPSIGKKGVRVTGKGPSVTPVTSATPIISAVETMRTASPATSVEEIPTPSSKRLRTSGKEMEKADSHSSTVWSDGGLAMDRAHGVVTAEDLKALNGVPFNVVANQQVHKLVQVIGLHVLLVSFSILVLTTLPFFSGVRREPPYRF